MPVQSEHCHSQQPLYVVAEADAWLCSHVHRHQPTNENTPTFQHSQSVYPVQIHLSMRQLVKRNHFLQCSKHIVQRRVVAGVENGADEEDGVADSPCGGGRHVVGGPRSRRLSAVTPGRGAL